MKIPPKGTPVLVTWLDSTSSPNWEYTKPGQDPEFDLRKIRTYGILTARGALSITVSSTVAEGDRQDAKTGHLCPLAIPLGAILSIREL